LRISNENIKLGVRSFRKNDSFPIENEKVMKSTKVQILIDQFQESIGKIPASMPHLIIKKDTFHQSTLLLLPLLYGFASPFN
jgi:hypothetical protein